MHLRTHLAITAACVTAATAGTAEAVTLISGNRLVDNSIRLIKLTPEARTALRGSQGPRGPRGFTGLTGSPGAAGHVPVYAVASTGTPSPTFLGLNGTLNTVEGQVTQLPAPPGTTVAVGLRGIAGPSENLTHTLRVNGVATALSCTALASSTCTAIGSVPVAATDKLTIGITSSTGKVTLPAAVLTFAP